MVKDIVYHLWMLFYFSNPCLNFMDFSDTDIEKDKKSPDVSLLQTFLWQNQLHLCLPCCMFKNFICEITKTSQSWRSHSHPGKPLLVICYPYVRKCFLATLNLWLIIMFTMDVQKKYFLISEAVYIFKNLLACVLLVFWSGWLFLFNSVFLKQPIFLWV